MSWQPGPSLLLFLGVVSTLRETVAVLRNHVAWQG
jgi:hypothetical protein